MSQIRCLEKSYYHGILGHMVKAQNEIKESLKLIDIVIEVLDARIPISSRNPLIENLAQGKERIILLNKSDLADKEQNIKWKKYFENKGYSCLNVCANNNEDIKKIVETINIKGKKIYESKYANKKIDIKPIYRVLIIGIPNVGKSTLINKIAKKQSAEVGNKPGVTKAKKWIRVSSNIDLLDTPGLLWPKLDEKDAGVKLALTGNIKQEILDVEEIAICGIELLMQNKKYRSMFIKKYKLENEDLDVMPYEMLELLGKKRGCVISGGEIDYTKASNIFLEELKNGKIGNITLDEI